MFEEYFEKEKINFLQVNKNQILQKPEGHVANAYYVKSGLLRSYLIDDDGKIHIYMFAPEGWIISDIGSHTLSGSTQLYIDVLEDSEVAQIGDVTPAMISSTSNDSSELIEKLFRRIAVLQRRVILLMSASAMQRYEHFIDTYPQLAHRVPQKMIASYLGITPEALSNI